LLKNPKTTTFHSGLSRTQSRSDDKLAWTVPITVPLKKEVLTWSSAKS